MEKAILENAKIFILFSIHNERLVHKTSAWIFYKTTRNTGWIIS